MVRTYNNLMLLLFTYVGVWSVSRATLAEEQARAFMKVDLILSDSTILTSDGLAYKVVIENISRSSITICGPTVRPRFACIVEVKDPSGDWRDVSSYSEMTKLTERGPIQIASGSKWAEYGQVFLAKGKLPVFSKQGAWELRARVTTAIGNVKSDPVPLNVMAWPKNETPVDKQFEPYGQALLNETFPPFAPQIEELEALSKHHTAGGVAKSLKLFLDVETYEKNKTLDGKAATRTEAFAAMSRELDEVRRDQLMFLLCNGAVRAKEWKEVSTLLAELKDESDRRRSLQGQLESAIITGQFRGR